MSFWRDVAELRVAIKEKVEQGHGKASLREAVAEQGKRAPRVQSARKRPSHAKTFFLAALFGALWQSSRRR